MSTQPMLPDVLPDAAWLARVRRDAGRWWATYDPSPTAAPGLTWGATPHGWLVSHRASGRPVGGTWPNHDAVRLWFWVALGLHTWGLIQDPARIDPERWADIAAAEARLRAALGLGR